jgi:uncharacterized protein YaaQ
VTVAGEQATELIRALNKQGFFVTIVDSRGGLIDERLSSLLIGLNRARLPTLLNYIRENCRTRRRLIPTQVESPTMVFQPMMIEAETGGATLYVIDVERFEQL